MLTALFIILMFAVFGKMIIFAFKASWGILKVLLTIIIFPLFLIGLFFSGLVYILRWRDVLYAPSWKTIL